MSTDPRLLWNGPKVEPRKLKPGIHLWSVYRDGRETRAELRPVSAFHGEGSCVEAQILREGELLTAKLHQSRELAEKWTVDIHKYLVGTGWTPRP